MPLRRLPLALSLAVLLPVPALARIDVTLDQESLNGMLASMAPDHVEVHLAAGRSLTLHMEDLRITGFDPAMGQYGGINAALRLVVPDLGIDLPVEPRLRLEIEGGDDRPRTSSLRFEKVMLDLPLTGPVDVAALLPTLSLLPEGAWMVNSAKGKVRVKPMLLDAKTGAKSIRLSFELRMDPAGP